VWLGVSAEDQETADERIPMLLECPAAVRFVSLEPLLGPVDLARWRPPHGEPDEDPREVGYGPPLGPALDRVIVGGEIGPGARPCDVRWIRNVVRQCDEAGVPVFVKQLGSNSTVNATPLLLGVGHGSNPADWPEDLRDRQGWR